MTSKTQSSLLKAFNKHLFEFVDEIVAIFPEKKELIDSRDYLITIKTANPTILLKFWQKYVSEPYKDQIEKGDLDFFLEKDYNQEFAHITNAMQVIKYVDTSLRNPLREMSADNRQHCIRYLILLSKISAAY